VFVIFCIMRSPILGWDWFDQTSARPLHKQI